MYYVGLLFSAAWIPDQWALMVRVAVANPSEVAVRIAVSLLPYVMQYNMESSLAKFGDIARAMGVDTAGMNPRQAA